MPAIQVLLVDDEELILRAMARHLTRAGHDSVCVTGAAAALALLAKQRFDVIVSDILMPRVGGLELLREVRRVALDVPVILMTGAPETETATAAAELGAFGYVAKPFDTARLVALIEDAARSRRFT